MRCSSDVLKKTSPLDVFGDVSEKVKHLTNDASNDVSRPALSVTRLSSYFLLKSLLGPALISKAKFVERDSIICHFIETKMKTFPAAKFSHTLQILHCSGYSKLVEFKTKSEERRSVVI